MPKDSVSKGRKPSEAKRMTDSFSLSDFHHLGLFNWWPSGEGQELRREVEEWLLTYEEEEDGFEGLGSLFGAENEPPERSGKMV